MAIKFKLEWRQWLVRARDLVCFRRPTLPDVALAVGAVSLIMVGLGLLSVPAYHHLRLRAKAAAVLGNAATLQLAAESYAAINQGQYAESALDLLPYLPADSAPVNPYTDGHITFAGVAGGLTYRSPTRGGDYVIQAFAMGAEGKPRLVQTLAGKSPH